MRSEQIGLLDFLGTPDALFDIPLFQRTYTWGAAQCTELWRDALRAACDGREHFIGIVLYDQLPDGRKTIVDGQQRLTTLMLLLSALAEYLDAHGLTLERLTGEDLRQTFLRQGAGPKLILSKIDRQAFDAALAGLPSPPDTRFPAQMNRASFLKAMEQEGFDLEMLWKGLRSLTIVAAQLTEGDDEQAIFESFNAKGVPLVTADLVRNHLLLAEDARTQRYLYENYWELIQGRFGDDPGSLKLNNAIRAWVTIRCRSIRAKDDSGVFFAFKCFCEDEYEGTKEDLLAELLSFAVVWAENYRYHAVKKFRSLDWNSIGRKTLVSGRKKAPVERGSYEYYTKHFGVDPKY